MESQYVYGLEEELEYLRQEMMSAAKIYGLQHPIVLDYSRQVDHKHNQLMRITMNGEAHRELKEECVQMA